MNAALHSLLAQADQTRLLADEALERAINDALELLRSQGYHVTRPELESETTMAELRAATRLGSTTLHKRLHHLHCPPWKATLCGPSGRVLRLRVSEEAMAFLRQSIQPGRGLAV